MKILCDIDGVLYDWDQAAREILQYGWAYDMPEPLTQEQEDKLWQPSTHWLYIPELVGKANWNWLWQSANATGMFLKGNGYWDNLKAVETLGERHETYLGTSRPKAQWWQTYHWLTFSGDEHPANLAGVLHTQDKVRTAIGLDIDAMIDDRPSQLEQYAKWAKGHHKRVWIYGMRRPWNESFISTYPGFKWVSDLSELLKEPWA